MEQIRRTKIVATVGPATDDPAQLRALIEAGANILRLNMSHGQLADHRRRFDMAKALSVELDRPIGILVDLQGPKIRIARFAAGKVNLKKGQDFLLDAQLPADAGDETRVGLDYPALTQDVKAGDRLLLDDGRIVLDVKAVKDTVVHCQVFVGGDLSNNKGINLQGGGLSAKALTDKDKNDIRAVADWQVDYFALSFPRSAQDIHEARSLLRQAGSEAKLIAKIERAEAIDVIDQIIAVSDGVMVARGDLGVELGFAELPAVQKEIIHRARTLDKAVITATQMMESMINNPIPTRAEVSDVANAVLDGTDAVMLSAESASGSFPVETVKAMHDICFAAERHQVARQSRHRVDKQFGRVDEAIAMAVMYTANHINIAAIIALTESGSTPLWMSRIRSGVPIFGLSRHHRTCGLMTLYRGVYPIYFDVTAGKPWEVSQRAIAFLKEKGYLSSGEQVIVTKGDVIGIDGGANAMKILMVP
jgi:pyruvate kinase